MFCFALFSFHFWKYSARVNGFLGPAVPRSRGFCRPATLPPCLLGMLPQSLILNFFHMAKISGIIPSSLWSLNSNFLRLFRVQTNKLLTLSCSTVPEWCLSSKYPRRYLLYNMPPEVLNPCWHKLQRMARLDTRQTAGIKRSLQHYSRSWKALASICD